MTDFGELLDKVDPESFIDDLGVDYRRTTGRSGDQINVKECPRCGGNDWKVFLNGESGLGNCFHGSCVGQPGFNLFTFASNSLKNKKEAYKLLELHAGRMGWKPKKKAQKALSNQIVTTNDLKLPDSIELPYKKSVGKYLNNRGFIAETVQHFQWRFSQKGTFVYDTAEGKRKQGYERRIIIPIHNLAGELVTFQGRDVTGEAEKKYLFPIGLPGTSLYLYNGHNAVGVEEIVINEGALDVAATHQAFAEDPLLRQVIPIGTFGKVVSMGRQTGEDQLGALLILKESGLKYITMMWDSEKKTLQDTAKAAQVLSKYGFKVRVAVLPKGMDPNEAKPMEVRDAFRNAISLNTKMDHMRFLVKVSN